MIQTIRRSVCRDCSWTASTKHYSRQDLPTLIVEHTVATAHEIDSDIIYEIDSDAASPPVQPSDLLLN